MDSPWPENLSKKAIDKLRTGGEFTNQLQLLLKSLMDDGLVSAQDLVVKISSSIGEAISILNCGESDEVSQIPAKSSPCWDGRKSEDSGESSKSSTLKLKDRRGCYKRRKTAESWTRITPTLIDDGRAWRKYGQKVILNAKHPRNYFRCTHKHDQGCQATKQVQKTDDNSPMYKITYNGTHTCRNLLKPPQIILDSIPHNGDSPIFLSFESKNQHPAELKQENLIYRSESFPTTLVKQESKEDMDIPPRDDDDDDHVTHHHNQSSSTSDYLFSHDLTNFDSSGRVTGLSSTLGSSDYGDSELNSCAVSDDHPHSLLDMDIVIGRAQFDDFNFEIF